MPITNFAGGTMITGAASIDYVRTLALRGALKLECKGMRMSRGRSAYSIVKQEFGFKGNKHKVLAQLEALVATLQSNPAAIQGEE